jgi:hypothetical protein
LKGSFEAKNLDMEELEIKNLFFVDYFSTFSFPLLLISSRNLL